ncbi:HD domain-containing protein [Natronogracilivirga saccharolytica]|uniref:HD domain-containing protein n=1 Tax=Natronogracilivirga saccharolytica TaxID=2812953 RepID=A0A8J7UW59_9BACT|nr:HD domain-containing protein [Natronogracilivirga saccharolytica]MBP3193277.1 HD domain-containing protein [Natronogracilivirga saccharolytica]
MDRNEATALLEEWIPNENLQRHCHMVASAMEAYARKLGKDTRTTENWWLAGLLHDLDWEKKPDEHPNYALDHIFPDTGLDEEVIEAIRAHAPERTGAEPESEIARYLYACDEISGFMHAVALMRPEGFRGMKAKSVTKKMKDKRFAANVNRDDIHKGAGLIETDLGDHIVFLAKVFENS